MFLDGLLAGDPFARSALRLLIAIIVTLAVMAMAFALATIYLRLANERRAARWRRLEERWREPLLAALAEPAPGLEALHARVEERYRLHFVRFVLAFARRVRGEELEVLKAAALPYLDPLVERADHPRMEVRLRAVQTLGELGLPRYLDVVVEALDDASPLVAMVAARALAREEYVDHLDELLQRLGRFESWSRGFIASMLASIGPSGGPALRATLADVTQPPWVRAVAAEALKQLGDLESADPAAEVVEVEDDRELLAAALGLLKVVGRPEHAQVIRVRCASPDFAIRAHALSALGELADDDDIPRLEAALDDPSPWVALHAARGLYTSGAVDRLEELAASEGPGGLVARQVLLEEGAT